MTTKPNCCPECGQPMRRIEQPALIPGRAPYLLEDCSNPSCVWWKVTLDAGEHAKMSPEQVEEYRALHRNHECA